MGWLRGPKGLITVAVSVCSLGLVGALALSGSQAKTPRVGAAAQAIKLWAAQDKAGSVTFKNQVPVPVKSGKARLVEPLPAGTKLSVDFGFPLRDAQGVKGLIAQEAQTHHYLSSSEIYARFSPPEAQVDALTHWLQSKGFTITHEGLDRLSVTATGTTAQVEQALHVKINAYSSPATSYQALKVKPYDFYSNTDNPKLPARFGVQTVTGLTSIDRFFTQVQLDQAATQAAGHKAVVAPVTCGTGDDSSDGGSQCELLRSGSGYYPKDIRAMYDVPATIGGQAPGTGQTLGFTLWGAGEEQAAQTAFAEDTGEPAIQVQTPCAATGGSPSTPDTNCDTQHVGANQLLNILENGNTNNNFEGNVETGLDIEQAHGEAPGAGLKYYLSDCSTLVPPGSGLTETGCDGSDTGMEEAVEDAANDPTLHSVSDSWAYGGEAELGQSDPFFEAIQNSLQIAVMRGTTFYFSTGDSGTYESGFPSDSQYVVGVGGTSLWSSNTLAAGTSATTNSSGAITKTGVPGTGTATLSTETTWDTGGSWCSNLVARPSWQNISQVNTAAPCPGRVIPDVSAVADPSTGVLFVASESTGPSNNQVSGGTVETGGVGGTSVAAPEMNGLEADLENFVAHQIYPGSTPAVGFEAPIIYQLGQEDSNAFFRDVQCGNTADPTSGPDGDAAQPGWDPATGWGAPDFLHFATGYAMALGATNLSMPSSDATNYDWSCAKTPSNSTERSISFPSSSVGYAVGSASGATPWPATFLPSGAWGATNTFFKTTDGGLTWQAVNSDMMGLTCTSTTTCIEVGDGGIIKRTSDGGNTWNAVSSPDSKALTSVTCPSSTVCYAAGDRGYFLKSTNGGQSWSYATTNIGGANGDGNPIYGLSCPSTTVCYTADIYGHVLKTSDGGNTWTWQTTPIQTQGVNVSGSGGPNPYAGLLSISCASTSTCVATGLYANVSGQALPSNDPPIITTTNGGSTWTLQTSHAGGTSNRTTTLSTAATATSTNIKVASVTGFVVGQAMIVDSTGANPETVTVTSVGTAGMSGTGVNFTPALGFAHNSGATVAELLPNYLNGSTCLTGTTTCFAVGRNGAIVTTTNLTTWTAMTSGTTNTLSGIECQSATSCIATGQGGTIDVLSGTTWTPTTGNGGTGYIAAIACQGATTCFTTGKQGVVLGTTNETTWTQQAGGGTTQQMNSISCPTTTTCFAVGNAATILATTNGGQTWVSQNANANTTNLSGVSCGTATSCSVVGAVSSGTAQTVYTTNGLSWQNGFPSTSNLALSGVSCVGSNCTAVGAGGVIVNSTNGGENWASQSSGTTGALSAVTCVGTTCYAAGGTTIVKGVSGTWSTQTSHSPQALSAIACVDASNCVAGGAGGTVVATYDGSTWAQQGNPLTGPTTALNASTSTGLGINGAACSATHCAFATGSSGDILISSLLVSGSAPQTVKVNSGQAVEILGGTNVTKLTVNAGGSADVEGGTIAGLNSDGASFLKVCNANVTDTSASITYSEGPVVVGGAGCAASSFAGKLTVSDNSGTTQVENANIQGVFNTEQNSGAVTATGNTIAGNVNADLDLGGVTLTGNTIGGDTSVTDNFNGVTVTGNSITGNLTVKGNSGTVVDRPNSVGGTSKLQ